MQIILQKILCFGIFFVPLQPEMRKIVLILSFVCLSLGVCAQVHTRTFNENIRTLRVPRAYLVLQDGIVDGTDAENSFDISFDEMSHEVHFYTYTVRHMNADWSRESDILSTEYLRGFTTQDIADAVEYGKNRPYPSLDTIDTDVYA